jgi:hypothetical protein
MLRVHEEPAGITRFAVHGVPVVAGVTAKVPVPVLLVPGTVVADVKVSGPVPTLLRVSVAFFTVVSAAPVTSPAG